MARIDWRPEIEIPTGAFIAVLYLVAVSPAYATLRDPQILFLHVCAAGVSSLATRIIFYQRQKPDDKPAQELPPVQHWINYSDNDKQIFESGTDTVIFSPPMDEQLDLRQLARIFRRNGKLTYRNCTPESVCMARDKFDWWRDKLVAWGWARKGRGNQLILTEDGKNYLTAFDPKPTPTGTRRIVRRRL